MMNFRTLSIPLALVASTALSAQQTVKIGALAPLTGFAAADGASVKNSLKLAVDHINASGGLLGKKVEVVLYDDHADPKEATALARKLIEQDQVKAFVAGSYSMPSRAITPISCTVSWAAPSPMSSTIRRSGCASAAPRAAGRV